MRSVPRLSAYSEQFDTRSVQGVFCHAQVAAEYGFHSFHICGCETLRGIFNTMHDESGSHRLPL